MVRRPVRVSGPGTRSKKERKGGPAMKAKFYDVKNRKAVQADVLEKKKYGKKGNERYAIRGKTADGRSLTKFVSKADWDKIAL